MLIKKYFLVLAFLILTVIALAYGVSPRWFAEFFLGETVMTVDFAHILRAIMCFSLALGLFWLFAAFNDQYRSVVVLSTVFCRWLGVATPDLSHCLRTGFFSFSAWIYKSPEFVE